MDLTWQQVSKWAYNTTDYGETSLAALEWQLPVVGMNGDQVREEVQLHVSRQSVAYGLQAVADLPLNLKEVIEPYFRPQTRTQPTPPRVVAGPKTEAAQAANQAPANAGGRPSFWSSPWGYLKYIPPPKDGNDHSSGFARWFKADF